MRVGWEQRLRSGRLVRAVRLCALAAWLAGCSHEARLGLQCPAHEPSCRGAGSAAIGGGRGGGEPDGEPAMPEPQPDDAATSAPLDAGGGHTPSVDAQVSTPDPTDEDGGPAAGECRSVAMSFFACASGAEQAGAPRLLANRPYTLRVRGDFVLDTTFQVQGASSACVATVIGPLTLPARSPLAERCITPEQDVALLVTVMSGDPQVWVQGLMAEVCDGCP